MDHFDFSSVKNGAHSFANGARDKADDLLNRIRLDEYLEQKKNYLEEKRDDERIKKTVVVAFAVLGLITVAAAAAYAVYRLVNPDYFEDYEDEDPYEDSDEDSDSDIEE